MRVDVAMPETSAGSFDVAAPPEGFVVARRTTETPDTFTIEIRPANGSTPPSFRPGQFDMVYVFGVGDVPISISGAGRSAATLRHTVRAVGNVTRAMARLRKGDPVGIRGPYGAPWPVDRLEGRDVVIAAGGIGLAPLRPVVLHLLANRPKFGRVALLYGARSPADLLFRRELGRWRGSLDLDVHVTVDRADRTWRGEVGVVTHLLRRAAFDPEETVALLCGPEIMMRFTAQELLRRGVEAERLYVSMERNMRCGVGLCGHCQYGPDFVCRDGPVFRFDRVARRLGTREV